MLRIRSALIAAFLVPQLAFAGTPKHHHAAAGQKPRPATPELTRPLEWLVAAQNDNGGWGAEKKTKPDVATTAIAGVALIRLGHTVAAGKYAEQVSKAVGFVVRAVDKTPANQVPINEAGTQPQAKLGRNIDTFLAAQFLAEALPAMKDGKEKGHVQSALARCVERIEMAQRKDGSYSADGWAPVLSSAFAQDGLYAAQRAGVKVRADVVDKGNDYMLGRYDEKTKAFKDADSAGVGLYGAAGTASAAVRSGKAQSEAGKASLGRLADESFLLGFGSYGGEEHVSYMMTSEALAKLGGEDFDRWDKGIRQRLASIQREDGTWRGDHCITSTTFCTAASLITVAVRSAKG